MMWHYCIESSAWSLAGLVAGYILGKTEHNTKKADHDHS